MWHASYLPLSLSHLLQREAIHAIKLLLFAKVVIIAKGGYMLASKFATVLSRVAVPS